MHALRLGVAAALLAAPAPLAAQTLYPTRTITLVSPQSPGTAMDVLARIYADKLAKLRGTPFVVSNRPGGGGIIAAQTVTAAAADGYSVLVANSGHPILGALNKKLSFNPTADFTPIAMIGETPALVVVIPGLGVRTLREFVALAKTKPGEMLVPLRPELEPPPTSPAPISRIRPASRCCTSRIRTGRTVSPTCWRAASICSLRRRRSPSRCCKNGSWWH